MTSGDEIPRVRFDLTSFENAWRPLRSFDCDFMSVGSIAVHRFGDELLVSNAAWMPGDDPVRTTRVVCAQLPNLPPVFPPRFAWSSRAPRAGDRHTSGFTSFLDPAQTGDQGGAFIELHPPAGKCGSDVVDSWIDCTPLAAYHRGSGRPLTRRELGVDFEYRLDRGRDPIQNLPQFVRSSEPADLQSWEAEDEYHLVRTFMRALGAWRERRDRLARFWIATLCADTLNAYQLHVIKPTSDWMPFSLGRMLVDAQRTPRKGGRIVRGLAWVIRLLAAGIELELPNASELRAALAALVRYVQLVQLPSGAFYSAPYADAHGNPTWADMGEAWNLYGLGHEYSECPSWQIPFLLRALWEAQVVEPALNRRVVSIITKAHQLWETSPLVPDMYGGVPGLPLYLVTGTVDFQFARITAGVGPARSMYDADAFAVFVRAGLLPRIPARYARAGEPGITDDAVRVAADFGVEGSA